MARAFVTVGSTFGSAHGTVTALDHGKVKSRFNYVALMPQARFLDFVAGKAAELPGFELKLGAKVTGLLDGGGVRFRDAGRNDIGAEHELPATLVVAADGRFSKIRTLAGLPAHSLGAQTDLLWFRLPHHDTDPPDADVDLFFGEYHYVGLLGGPVDWQIGYSLPKGGYAAVREAGVEPIRAFLTEHLPWLGDRVEKLTDMNQTTLLSVDISRVERWHKPGLLLIGDAAHVISPVGGNGILMAIQDAIAAANRLVGPLRAGTLTEGDLAAVQRDREPSIIEVQAQQVRTEKRVAASRESGRPIAPPAFLRLLTAIPGVRGRAARANAYGPNPPRLDPAVLAVRA